MAGVSIQINIKDHVSPMLRGMINNIKDFRTPLKQAGLYMYRETVRQFDSEGARAGTPWPPLSERTLQSRRQGRNKKHSDKILSDTGRLRASITGPSAPKAIYRLNENSLRLGTNVEYASAHQYGINKTITVTKKPGSVRLRKIKNGQYRFASKKFRGKARKVDYAGGKSYSMHMNIPARSFLVMTEENRRFIGDIFLRHALKG